MPSPLIDYLKVQKATDQQILNALRDSAASIDRELRRLESQVGIGAAVRAEQLRMVQIRTQEEMARLWTRVGEITEAQKAVAAGEAARGILANNSVLSTLFSEADRDYMARSAAATAARGLEAVERRLEGSSYVPLAESVYKNNAVANGAVDNLVNAALARGASAAELAKDVRDYVNPNTPGGARYASLRLARTEINNSFHASQVKTAQESPWVTGVLWNLSGSHPVPDECNTYAETQHFDGGDVGVFKPTEVPGKPHPNCLCYTTTVDVDRDEFIRQFETGAYDTYLQEQFDLSPEDMIRISPSKAVREYAWGQGDSGELVYGEINGNLRKGNPLTGTAKAVSEGLDKAFTLASPTKTSTTVYRQFPGQDEALVRELLEYARAGKVWTDKAFLSTTKSEDILPDFDNLGTGVRLNIRVPPGSKVIHVDDYLEEMDFRQDEWLLPRGTKLTFGKPRRDPDSDGWIIDARVGDTPVKPVQSAISPATKIAQLEERIRSEQARARKNPRLKSVTSENIRKARAEINRLRKQKR